MQHCSEPRWGGRSIDSGSSRAWPCCAALSASASSPPPRRRTRWTGASGCAARPGACALHPTPPSHPRRCSPRWLARARSPDIPLSDPRLAATSSVEQVHLTGGSPDRAIVTYVTNTTEPTAVKFRPAEGAADGWLTASGPPGQVYSFSQDPRFPATEGGCMGPLNYTNPECFYSAPPSLRAPTAPPLS